MRISLLLLLRGAYLYSFSGGVSPNSVSARALNVVGGVNVIRLWSITSVGFGHLGVA